MLIFTILCITEVDPKTTLFSWKYLDGPYSLVDPLNIALPPFDEWEMSNSDNDYDSETISITLNKDETAKIEYTFEIPSNQAYTFLTFQCHSEKIQSLSSATCTLSILNEIIEVELGKSYNYSSSLNLNQVSINITLSNKQSSPVEFSSPIITLYRSPFYSDISFTQQYPVKGQTKAVFCELFLNQSIGKIELHTIHVSFPHKIPSAFSPHNQFFGGEGSTSFEFTTLPIISSETRIVGMNIFDSTLKLWRLYEADDNSEIGYCIDIEPVPPFRVTYIIIETSSINFPDALEIWHNQFNNSFLLPDPSLNYGSIATPSATDDYCIKSFYQKHMWGGEQIKGFPPMKSYIQMEKFTLELPVDPKNILDCAENQEDEYYDKCILVKKFGIVTKDNEFSVETKGSNNYVYNVIWSPQIETEYNEINNFFKNKSFSGFAIDLSVAETMNYNSYLDDPQYFLIDNDGNEFKPAISSMYQLLYSYRDTNLDVNNILISDFFHPQFINVILTQGVVVNLIDPKSGANEHRLKYDVATHNRLWRVRAQMGSNIFTILEQSDPRSILHISEDLFSICLTLGALPSFYYPKWNDCPYLDYIDKLKAVYETWEPRFRQVLFNTTYNANGINMIQFSVKPELQIPQIPGLNDAITRENKKNSKSDSVTYIEEEEDEDLEGNRSYVFGTICENNSFYEASTYCNSRDTQDDGLIDCFEVILLGINVTLDSPNDRIFYQRVVTATFTSEQSPTCIFASSPLTCKVNDQSVDIKLNATITSSQTQIYRAALVSFKVRVGQSFQDWFRENFGAIIGSFIIILLLFIAMGFGIWFMYCRKKKDHNDLDRIMNKEINVRKEKREKLIKLRNEQLNANNTAKDNEFKNVDEELDDV